MISSDIDRLIDRSISSGMVISRMLDLMSLTGAASEPDAYLMARIAAHKRRADRSSCMCPYCSAIKTYVRAKRWVHWLERDVDIAGISGRDDGMRLALAATKLKAAIYTKDRAKTLDISGWVLADSS